MESRYFFKFRPQVGKIRASIGLSTTRLRADRTGSIPVVLAVSAMPALLLVAAAVDYSRSTAIVVQAQADAAALAAGG